MSALVVLDPGPLTTIQDLGRAGHAASGVPPSGAVDAAAHAAANRLVGNSPGAAGLEVLLGGARLLARGSLVLAVTGAAGALVIHAGSSTRPAPLGAAFRLPDGAALAIGPAGYGVRYSVAVRGGVLARLVLGSAATDTLSGLGPPPVARGEELPVGAAPPSPVPAVDVPWPVIAPGGGAVLRVLPGPRLDRFGPGGLDRLTATAWTVSTAADRVGVRLTGERLRPVDVRELPSEGVVTGAIQVPPDGRPIVFLADHPVTGGYPVVAVVASSDLGTAAQLRPGDAVRFVR